MSEAAAKTLVQAIGDYVVELMDGDPEFTSTANLRYQEDVLVALLMRIPEREDE